MLPVTPEILDRARKVREELVNFSNTLKRIYCEKCSQGHRGVADVLDALDSCVPSIEDCVSNAVKELESTLESQRESFVSTGNPSFAWDAYRQCRADGVPIREWILDYLDECADSLVSEISLSLKTKGKSVNRDTIKEIFQFNTTGQGSYIARGAREFVKQKAILLIGWELKSPKARTKLRGQSDLDSIIDEVTKSLSACHPGLKITFETVRSWWREYSSKKN